MHERPPMARLPRVLFSFSEPDDHSNPYVVQLVTSLEGHAEVVFFSWRTALLGRYDVFHIHWPEMLLRSSSPGRAAAKRLLFRALLLRLSVNDIPIIRTLHNLRPHETSSGPELTLLERLDRATSRRILLSNALEPEVTDTIIPHGHYRDWFPKIPSIRLPRPHAHILFFGVVRPYKGVESLLGAFQELGRSGGWSLTVAGRPMDDEYANDIRERVASLSGVDLRLRHINDHELFQIIESSDLVALPYREFFNSGAAILALSLNRPILAPRTIATELLRKEVGGEWVQLYDGELTSTDLERAIKCWSARVEDQTPPSLSERDWGASGDSHGLLYHSVSATRRRA